jgi:hypothetical protein
MYVSYDTPHDVGVPVNGQPVLCRDLPRTEPVAVTPTATIPTLPTLLPARGGR